MKGKIEGENSLDWRKSFSCIFLRRILSFWIFHFFSSFWNFQGEYLSYISVVFVRKNALLLFCCYPLVFRFSWAFEACILADQPAIHVPAPLWLALSVLALSQRLTSLQTAWSDKKGRSMAHLEKWRGSYGNSLVQLQTDKHVQAIVIRCLFCHIPDPLRFPRDGRFHRSQKAQQKLRCVVWPQQPRQSPARKLPRDLKMAWVVLSQHQPCLLHETVLQPASLAVQVRAAHGSQPISQQCSQQSSQPSNNERREKQTKNKKENQRLKNRALSGRNYHSSHYFHFILRKRKFWKQKREKIKSPPNHQIIEVWYYSFHFWSRG